MHLFLLLPFDTFERSVVVVTNNSLKIVVIKFNWSHIIILLLSFQTRAPSCVLNFLLLDLAFIFLGCQWKSSWVISFLISISWQINIEFCISLNLVFFPFSLWMVCVFLNRIWTIKTTTTDRRSIGGRGKTDPTRSLLSTT